MTNRRPIGAIESLRNTRRSLGDGTLAGRSRIATPRRLGTGRSSSASAVVSAPAAPDTAGGAGETITLRATGLEIPAGGADVTFDEVLGSREGFGSLTVPTNYVEVSAAGYYDIHLSFRWEDWRGGGAIQSKVNDTTVYGPAVDARMQSDSGVGWKGVAAPHRLMNPGNRFEINIDHGDSEPHTLDEVVVTVGLVEGRRRGDTDQVFGNLLLVVGDLDHPASGNVLEALSALGQTVEVVDESQALALTATDYDLVFVNRPLSVAAFNTWLANAVDAGVPACVDPTVGGGSTGAQSDHALVSLGLTSSGFQFDAGEEPVIQVVDTSHPITSAFNLGGLAIYQVDSYMTHQLSGEAFVGTDLALFNGQNAMVAIEEGTARLASGVTGARVVWSTAFYAAEDNGSAGGAPYTDEGLDLVRRSVQWALGGL